MKDVNNESNRIHRKKVESKRDNKYYLLNWVLEHQFSFNHSLNLKSDYINQI